MAKILAVQTAVPPYRIQQEEAKQLIYELYGKDNPKIRRLLSVFENGGIQTRYVSRPLEWFKQSHSFEEKNNGFIETAVELGGKAIKRCIEEAGVDYQDIDAIITVSTTGLAAPSLDARIMNQLPFSPTVTRIPLWGLGCGGGASGLARAYDYCRAYPQAQVLVLAVELCSLTFQLEDLSKSNIVGTSLFADGAACALVAGERSQSFLQEEKALPVIQAARTVLMKNSESVMGWTVKNDGFFVVFSKDIPTIVNTWLAPQVKQFFNQQDMSLDEIKHIIVHPGGKKVLDAYGECLRLSPLQLSISKQILEQYGNMSSVTVLFVLKKYLDQAITAGECGLALALGPGFSAYMLSLRWE
ncbi:type III polyketide synthase [Bacillus xiapuensis]|uniref:type III polyketide synthase n=1 Tax=Bacillus xiapuensis TaxID=2014075 RepID=UPI000C249CE2|nr:3-oxoacyl-[acyl-carrier-protein] synthase III C-terminal domain-containing protein [Bacillus xiapuensis]